LKINERQGLGGASIHQNFKTHATGEFIIVVKNGGHMVYCLSSGVAI